MHLPSLRLITVTKAVMAFPDSDLKALPFHIYFIVRWYIHGHTYVEY